ncbi:MAG: hypothetical protein FWE15_20085 [Actinomycetia bacterium]|nr:hypothetical protein [Actinomycetes bacterium]
MNVTLALVPADDYARDSYGMTHESQWTFDTAASRVFPTRVEVWDNTRRKNDDGTYTDPRGRTTSEDTSYLLSPQSVMITSGGDGMGPHLHGPVIREGDGLVLKYPDGSAVQVRVTFEGHGGNGYGEAHVLPLAERTGLSPRLSAHGRAKAAGHGPAAFAVPGRSDGRYPRSETV